MPGERMTRAILDAIHYSGATSLAGRTMRGRGAILMLHRVGPDPESAFAPNSHLSISPQFLRELLSRLSAGIHEFVSLDEALVRIRMSEERAREVRPFLCVTLDDGYRDNLENAVPLFRQYSVPYTIYVAPGLVDGRATLWWEDLEHILASNSTINLDMPGGRTEFDLRDARAKQEAFEALSAYITTQITEQERLRIIRDLAWMYRTDPEAHRTGSIMNWKELAQLSTDPLCTLGAHTIHHHAVARLSPDEALFEMEESARLIELETGSRPKHFAYPYGYPAAAGSRDFDLARQAGFQSAVTTRHGVCHAVHANHLTALPRISVNGRFQEYRYVKTLLSGIPTRIANKGELINVG